MHMHMPTHRPDTSQSAPSSPPHSPAQTASSQRRADRLMRWVVLFAVFAASAAVWWPAQAARIKELASVQGVRTNQLTGFGLVFGLDGTGDQSTQAPYTPQALAAFLEKNGIALPPGVTMQPKNLAAVVVTADLPPFAQRGQRIDINVSSAGNAKSLRGGLLLSTPLRGADGKVYAIAQGSLIVGGAGASAGGSKVQINHLASGRVPDGAMVEEVVPTLLGEDGVLQLDVNSNDFATARAVAQAINLAKGEGTAQALDGRVVKVRLPKAENDRVAFIADVEDLNVALTKPAAKVVLNARTGSVVVNEAVTLSDCAVAHGALQVTINSTPIISQPSALSQGGQTVQAEKVDISISQQPGALIQLPASTKLSDVVRALNSLGATPQDLLAILQAMKAAGALKAELEVI